MRLLSRSQAVSLACLIALIAVFSLPIFRLLSPRLYAAAGIHKTIDFQGKLVNTDGTNVTDGDYSITFTLYDASSGGSNLWDETQTVSVADGLFQVELGSVDTTIGNVDFNSDSLYLGVKVGTNTEMTPRIRFTAVPYAFNAEKVSGLTVTNTTGTFTLANSKTLTVNNSLTFEGSDGTTLTFQGTDTYVGRTTSDTLTNKTIGSTGLTFSGATTDITTGTNEDFVVAPNGSGRIGLGTTTPLAYTHINSQLGTVAGASISSQTSFAAMVVDNKGVGDLFTASSSGLTRLVLSQTGNLGLGTTLPTALLQAASTSTVLQSSGLGYFDWSPSSSSTSTSDLFTLNVGSNGTLAKIFNIKDGGTSVFSISQSGVESNLPVSFNAPGDVAVAYDLAFTNPTASYLKSSAPLYLQAGETFNSSDLTLSTYNKGNVIVDSEAFLTTGSATVSGQLVLGSTTPTANSIGQFYVTNASTLGKALVILNQTESSDIFTASAAGTTKFVINSGGNVGIGTTTPSSVLNVKYFSANSTATTPALSLDNPSGGTQTSLAFKSNGSAKGLIDVDSGGAMYLNTAGSGNLYLGYTSLTGTPNGIDFLNGKARFDSNGNLGVGTTEPSGLFQVLGLASTTPTASISARSSFAGLVVDNTIGDLFTASSSGLPRFSITNEGGIAVGGSTGTSSQCLTGGTTASWGLCGSSQWTDGTGGIYYNLGNIGIGTTDLSSPVSIKVTAPDVNNGYGVSIGADLTAVNNQAGFGAYATVSPSGATDKTYTGLAGNIQSFDNSTNLDSATLIGLRGYAYFAGTGSYGIVKGGDYTVELDAAGAISKAYGLTVGSGVKSAGTISQLYGMAIFSQANGTDSNIGLLVDNTSSATNNINFLLGQSSIPSGSWSIYNGSSYDNYFAGDIGIGTTTVESKLHVLGTGNSKGIVTINGDGNQALFTASISGSTKFLVDKGGNVGIGTTNPGSQLNIAAATTSLSQLRLNSSAGVDLSSPASGDLWWNGTDLYFNNGTINKDLLSNDYLTIRKASSETVTNSTTLQDDDELTFSVGANETWIVDIVLQGDVDATPDIKLGVNAPSGSTCTISLADNQSVANTYDSTTCGTEMIASGNGTGDLYYLRGTVVTGGTGGNITVQWTQNSSSPNAVTILPGSYLVAYNLTHANLSAVTQSEWVRNNGVITPKGSSVTDMLLGSSATSSAKFAFMNVAGGIPTASIAGNLTFNGIAGVNNHQINLNDNGSLNFLISPKGEGGAAARSALFMSQTGNIGLGTTNPGGSLDIRPVSGTTPTLILAGAASDNLGGKIYLTENNSLTTGAMLQYDGSGNFLDFQTGNSALQSRVVILRDSGNVGIGTTTPNGLFNVNGAAAGKALVALNQDGGDQDVLTASVSGATKFTVLNNGGVRINNLNSANCDVKADTTGLLSCGTDAAPTSKVVVKGTDENVPSGTTLQNDDELTFAVGAGETWVFDFSLLVTNLNSATPDWKAAVLGASGWTCSVLMYGEEPGNTGFPQVTGTDCDNAPTALANGTILADVNIPFQVHLQGRITTTSAGSVTLQWAPNTSGSLTVKAGSYVTAQKVGGSDLAETYYAKDDNIRPGDIVSIDSSIPAGVKKSTSQYDVNVLGVVSTKPGLLLGDGETNSQNLPVNVALSGRIPTKVSTENGPIYPGDYLTSSSMPGVAMKATKAGFVIGQALDAFDKDGVGTVLTFVKNTFYSPPSLDDARLTAIANAQIIENTNLDLLAEDGTVSGLTKYEVRVDGKTVEKRDIFSELVAGMFRVGRIDATSIFLGDKSLFDLFSTKKQDEEIDQLKTDVASVNGKVLQLEEASILGASQSAQSSQSDEPSLLSSKLELDSSLFESNATISGKLTVLGRTVLSDLGVTGDITTGYLSINGLEGSFNTFSLPLKLQSLKSAGIDILDGTMTIDTEGNLYTEGEIKAKKVNIDESDLNIASIGQAVIKAGQLSTQVTSNALTSNSKIFATPDVAVSIGVKSTDANTFTITLDKPAASDVKINWWIVN